MKSTITGNFAKFPQGLFDLTTYTDYRVTAESFMTGQRNSLTANPDTVDINDNWETDTHGNQYRFGLYGTSYPKTLWMNYSPDGNSTQTMGAIRVNDAVELNEWKERYRKDLLAAKKSHTNYNGGTYDIFQGWDEKGEKVWWSIVRRSDSVLKYASFSPTLQIAEATAKELTKVSIPENFNSNDIFFRSLFGLDYASFEQQANASLKQLVQLTDQQLSLQIGTITDTSFDVSSWSNNQKEVSKVIVSLTGISGFAAADVKAFQLKAINQLDRLGSDYEQDIINDTMLAGRTGNIEELRTVVVLQKLSALFIQKGLEMEKMKDMVVFDKASRTASQQYAIEIQSLYEGVKRLYFIREEGVGESNLKRNETFTNLASVSKGNNPGGRVSFVIEDNIDLSNIGNILLGYNARSLGLSLEETILGSEKAQVAAYLGANLYDGLIDWSKDRFNMVIVPNILDGLASDAIDRAYKSEETDKALYEKGYNLLQISPRNLLQAIISQ